MRVEWRIEVDQINRLVRDIPTQDVKVVAVVKEISVDRGPSVG
jgi:hypothetical protein